MTIFKKILDGEIPSKKVYEDERVYAFDDVNPQAPVHVLVIPKKEIASLNEMDETHEELLGHLLFAAKKVAEIKGVTDSGWRLVINTNEAAGQTVFHIHAHVLGGRQMGWPPG